MSRLRLDPAFAALLQDSFLRLTGRPLVAGGPVEAGALYDAAPPLLAHDTSGDPLIIYANRAAQACFGYGPDEFAGLPSRLSAEDQGRAARQRLLDAVAAAGFVRGYGGVRIAKSGRRFRIEDTTVWELVDRDGVRHGQAATFRVGRDAG